MSYDRGEPTERFVVPRRPAAAPPPPGGDGGGSWSPGTFSPAVFIVAAVVVLLLAGVAVLSRRGATAAPTATVPANAQPTAPRPTAGQQPTVAPAAPTAPPGPSGRVFVVANTGGQGVFLRRTPSFEDRDTAYRDGTRLEQIGPDVTAEGRAWRHVRAPDGRAGWVPAEFTEEER